MKGLLLKDFYLSVKYYKPYFLVLFVFAAMSLWTGDQPFLVSYPFMLTSMLAPGLVSIDENSTWDVYCGAMPCTKKQMVCEKYLIGLFWSAIGLVVVMLSQLLGMALNGGIRWGDLGDVLALCLFLIFFLPAISLPFVFKFGAEKGRISQYLIIGCVCGGSTVLSLKQNAAGAVSTDISGVPFLLVAVAAGLYALSWLASIRFYEKRELR